MKIQDLFRRALKQHWGAERYTESGWVEEVKRSYRRYIEPTFGLTQAEDITRAEIRAWHQSMAKTPYGANRTLSIFCKTFEWGVENDLVAFNPCLGVKPHPEKKRKRFASETELQKLIERLDHYETKGWKTEVAFIWALLMTGARPRSLEKAQWEDLVRFDDGSAMLVSAGKTTADTGQDDEVVFPKELVAKIEQLPKRNGFVFCGIALPRFFWEKIRKEVGCEDLRARDLRRTFATVGLSDGVALDTIGEVLNHRNVQTTKIYAKLMNKKKVEAVEQISNRVLKIAGKK